MKKKQLFFLLLVSLFFFIGETMNAESVVSAGNQVGIWSRFEDLQYGFSRRGSSSNGYAIPDIQYISKDSRGRESVINHIYKTSNQSRSTTGFILFYNDNILNNSNRGWNARGDQTYYGLNFTAAEESTAAYVNFPVSSIIAKTLPNGTTAIEASRTTAQNYLITATMFPDLVSRDIVTVYSVKNLNTTKQTVYPAKSVDTDLNGNDQVPLYSRGEGKGIFMKTGSGNSGYQMDYAMTYKGIPGISESDAGTTPYYSTKRLGSALGFYSSDTYSNFGVDYNHPAAPQMNKSEGEVLFSESGMYAGDSAIFFTWGPVTLQPNETFYGGYEVGLKDTGNIGTTNSMENLTTGDNTNNNIGDQIKYKSTVSAPGNSRMNNVTFKYKLPTTIDKPSKITIGGVNKAIDTIFDARTRTINITDIGNLAANGKIDIEIETKILNEAKGQSVISEASATGFDSTNRERTDYTVCEFIVNRVKPFLNIQYKSDDNVVLADADKKQVDLDSTQTVKAKEIPGYKVSSVKVDGKNATLTNNSVSVSLKEDDRSVEFFYKSIHFSDQAPDLQVNKATVSKGDTLNYTLVVKSGMVYNSDQTVDNYRDFTINVRIDPSLDDPRNITIKKTDGTNVGSGSYNEQNGELSATLTSDVKNTEDLILTYQATVNETALTGNTIEQQATIKATYTEKSGNQEIIVKSNVAESTVQDVINITINFYDKNGNQITQPITKVGFVGDTYDFSDEKKVIPNYKFIKADDKHGLSPIKGKYPETSEGGKMTINFIYEILESKMTVKQVYSSQHNQFIYKDIEKQLTVNKEGVTRSETIGTSIPEIIKAMKEETSDTLKIDYEWYEPIDEKVDYLILVNGEKIETDKVPESDFELLLVYTGITKLEVSNLNYGKIPMSKNNNQIYDNPNKDQQVTVTNTNLSSTWKLDIALENNEIRNIDADTNEVYLGGLLVEKDKQTNIITDQGITFSKESEQSNKLLSSIPMDIKLYQDIGNSLGNYKGNVIWSLQDTPVP